MTFSCIICISIFGEEREVRSTPAYGRRVNVRAVAGALFSSWSLVLSASSSQSRQRLPCRSSDAETLHHRWLDFEVTARSFEGSR